MRRSLLLMSLLVMATMMPTVSSAQDAGPGYGHPARISGKVLANGKPAVGVTVTASDCATGQKYVATTNGFGSFSLSSLYGFRYSLAASSTSSDGKIMMRSPAEMVQLGQGAHVVKNLDLRPAKTD